MRQVQFCNRTTHRHKIGVEHGDGGLEVELVGALGGVPAHRV